MKIPRFTETDDNIVFTFLKIVVEKKAWTRKCVPQTRSPREESINIVRTPALGNFKTKMTRASSQSRTALKSMKSRYQRGWLIRKTTMILFIENARNERKVEKPGKHWLY